MSGFDMNEVKNVYKQYLTELDKRINKNQKSYLKFLNSDKFGGLLQEILLEDASIGIVDSSSMKFNYEVSTNKIVLIFYNNKTYELSDNSGEGTLGDIAWYYNTLLTKLSDMGLKVLEKPKTEEDMVKQVNKGVPMAIRMSFKHLLR